MGLTKVCSRCKTDLPVSEFHRLHSASDGLQYSCKACSREADKKTRNKDRSKATKQEWYRNNRDISIARAKLQRGNTERWRQENRERVNAVEKYRKATTEIGQEGVAHATLMRRFAKFGLTLDQYHAMAEAQDFQCACCGQVPTPTQGGAHDGFHIDHHHVTGKVRGLLCGGCNVGMGMLQDSPEVCELAASYLRATTPVMCCVPQMSGAI